MAIKNSVNEKLGIITIGFSPVVREGLQSIMTKDERIEVIGDASDGNELETGRLTGYKPRES
jgi:DNA-binding NarL/FixJ family response regulator